MSARSYRVVVTAAGLALLACSAWAQGPPRAARPSFWLDPIHLRGIAAAVIMLVAMIIGLTIFFGLRRRGLGYDAAARVGRRRWHIAFGLTGGGLAIAHAIGRYYQFGKIDFAQTAPNLTLAAVLLIAVSGVLRALLPYRFATVVHAVAWFHRLGVVSMLGFAAWHATGAVAFHYARLAAAAAKAAAATKAGGG